MLLNHKNFMVTSLFQLTISIQDVNITMIEYITIIKIKVFSFVYIFKKINMCYEI
jgi:hypothetical protein